MLCFGVLTLVRGKFYLTRTRVVEGMPAYVVGVALMLPLPLCFCAGLLIGIVFAVQGKELDPRLADGPLRLLELGIHLLCLVAALGIAVATAGPEKRRAAPADGDFEDFYEGADDPRGWRGPAGKSDVPSSEQPRDEGDRTRNPPPDDRFEAKPGP
jgi:hypothetical protein